MDLISETSFNTKDKMIRGCQILMPETVFLKDGKFDCVV